VATITTAAAGKVCRNGLGGQGFDPCSEGASIPLHHSVSVAPKRRWGWEAVERSRATVRGAELVAGVRVPAGEAESDPQWIAADDAAGEALAVQDDLALKLLETQPTTIAGAAALLIYYVDAVTTAQPEVVFPELDANGRPFESKSIDEPRRDFAYFIIRNVAAALSNMAPAGEGY
jgi:hypothetical protein